MVVCPVIRASLSLYLLLCTLPVVASSSAFTSWTADCGDGIKDTVSCTLEVTECYSRPRLSESVHKGALKAGLHLSITPIFTAVFADDRAGGESRWYPKVNISWLNAVSSYKSSYFVRMAYRDKDYVRRDTSCDKCFTLTAVPSHNPTRNMAAQQVSLLSGNVFHCNSGLRPVFLHVRVRELGRTKAGQVAETSMSFPDDIKTSRGLPTCYRRIVPNTDTNCRFNPCTWTTPLVVSNSSCNKEVRVEFELALGDVVNTYVVRLVEQSQVNSIIRDFIPTAADVSGRVTFKGVHPGVYAISLKLSVDHKRYPQINNGGCIMPVRSGYVTLTDGSNCTAVSNADIQPDNQSDNLLLFIILMVSVAVILICMALAGTFCYGRRKNPPMRTFEDSPNNDPSNEPTESGIVTPRRRVLLVYCMDNCSHRLVVYRFAELLQVEGLCDVILDQCHMTSIQKHGIYGWIGRQYVAADKVIVVGSEAMRKFIDAKRVERYFPTLETAFPMSQVFPSAIRVLHDAIFRSSHTESKALAVTFDYTATTQSSTDTLRDLTGNDISYKLTRDLERVLLTIHDTSKYKCGNSIMEWNGDIMKTAAGMKLQAALEEAGVYHSCNPNWFTDAYGSPEPYPDIRAPCTEMVFSDDIPGDIIFTDHEGINLIGPDDISCDIIFSSKETLSLIGPDSMLGEVNFTDHETLNLIGPENCESEAELDAPLLETPSDKSPSDKIPLRSSWESYHILCVPEEEEEEVVVIEEEKEEKEVGEGCCSNSPSIASLGEQFDSGIVMSLPMRVRSWSTDANVGLTHTTGHYDVLPNKTNHLLCCDDGRGLLSHYLLGRQSSISSLSSLSGSVSLSGMDMEERLVLDQSLTGLTNRDENLAET